MREDGAISVWRLGKTLHGYFDSIAKEEPSRAMESARLRLANAVLLAASEENQDAEVLELTALEVTHPRPCVTRSTA